MIQPKSLRPFQSKVVERMLNSVKKFCEDNTSLRNRTIGLVGPRGRGKTTILRELKTQIEDNQPLFLTTEVIDAYAVRDNRGIMPALFYHIWKAIERKLEDCKIDKERIKQHRSEYSKLKVDLSALSSSDENIALEMAATPDQYFNMINALIEKNEKMPGSFQRFIEKCLNDISQNLKKGKKYIVVFIDDLDLVGYKALEYFFYQLSNSFRLNNVLWVMSYDIESVLFKLSLSQQSEAVKNYNKLHMHVVNSNVNALVHKVIASEQQYLLKIWPSSDRKAFVPFKEVLDIENPLNIQELMIACNIIKLTPLLPLGPRGLENFYLWAYYNIGDDNHLNPELERFFGQWIPKAKHEEAKQIFATEISQEDAIQKILDEHVSSNDKDRAKSNLRKRGLISDDNNENEFMPFKSKILLETIEKLAEVNESLPISNLMANYNPKVILNSFEWKSKKIDAMDWGMIIRSAASDKYLSNIPLPTIFDDISKNLLPEAFFEALVDLGLNDVEHPPYRFLYETPFILSKLKPMYIQIKIDDEHLDSLFSKKYHYGFLWGKVFEKHGDLMMDIGVIAFLSAIFDYRTVRPDAAASHRLTSNDIKLGDAFTFKDLHHIVPKRLRAIILWIDALGRYPWASIGAIRNPFIKPISYMQYLSAAILISNLRAIVSLKLDFLINASDIFEIKLFSSQLDAVSPNRRTSDYISNEYYKLIEKINNVSLVDAHVISSDLKFRFSVAEDLFRSFDALRRYSPVCELF